MKKLILPTLLIIAILLSVGVVSASENVTQGVLATEQVNDNIAVENQEINSADEYEYEEQDNTQVEIIAKSVTKKYSPNNKITVKIRDCEGEYASVDSIKYKYDNGKVNTMYLKDTKDGETYNIPCNLDPGTHKLTISVKDSFYKAHPITINVQITKLDPTIKVFKDATYNKKVTLKATVTCNGKKIKEGKVKFKINGKTYTVNVKNGVAEKKLKIKNGYHKYTATFTSKHYNTKSKSNYAIKGNKYYTLKTQGLNGKTYTMKVPFKSYLKLIEAKRAGTYTYIELKTGKKAKFESTKDIYKTKTVYKWKKIKVLDYEEFWSYGTSYSYDTYKYYKSGWTYVGSMSKTFSDGYEHYSIFKKKVKTKEKVYVGSKTVYSSKSYPLRFSALINENGKLYCRWDISRENQLKANLVIPHWNGKL